MVNFPVFVSKNRNLPSQHSRGTARGSEENWCGELLVGTAFFRSNPEQCMHGAVNEYFGDDVCFGFLVTRQHLRSRVFEGAI
jgi:hypothetical protein